MNVSGIFKAAERFAAQNSPAILTAVGVTGTLTAAVLTGKASFRAAAIIDKEQCHLDSFEVTHTLDNKERFLLVWREYIPAGAVLATTVVAIIAANQIGTRRTAAIAAAYTLTEHAFSDYRGKVIERLGAQKEQAVRDSIAEDSIRRNPPGQIVILGSSVLCFDEMSGRYFSCDVEAIKQAQNKINYIVTHEMYASLSDFYDMIGLEPTTMSGDIGWNIERKLELRMSTVLSPDGRPALSLSYNIGPLYDHNRCIVN